MIYISLGSNLGNRIANFHKAISLIKQRCLKNTKTSIIVETEAILLPDSPSNWNKPFLNMIIAGKSELSPILLLKALKLIEIELGRPRNYEKWAPRIIDLDILLYYDAKIDTPELAIPHPQLPNRIFFKHLLALMGVEPYKFLRPGNNIFTKSSVLFPQIVGIVNLTNDSFSDGGNFYNPKNAIDQIDKLINDGASAIEIGAQSTKPNAIIQSPKFEYDRLINTLGQLTALKIQELTDIFIDTFRPSVIKKLLKNYHISGINDVSGQLDDYTLALIADYDCKLCLMHSVTIPPNQNDIIPPNLNPIEVINEWGKRSIEHLLKMGFSLNNIILDPGIGFGKTAYQNIEILKSIGKLKNLGAGIMVGHSRKGYINAFAPGLNPNERDLETVAISMLSGDKVDYLRVHNARDHMRAMVASKVLE